MDLKIDAKSFEQMYNLVAKKEMSNEIKFVPRKKPFNENIKSTPLVRDVPENQGVSSRRMACFLKELETNGTNVHQVVVAQNGKIICQGAMSPFKNNMWHVTHSMCKTITAMAIGILIKDKKLKLDDKIVKILERHCMAINRIRMNKITVEHLLTMSSGVNITETVVNVEVNWLKAYFESGLKFDAGSKFNYNSMNSYVLSTIVQEITGVNMFTFLKLRLFKPLGINNVHWESCPLGKTKGGWGMYMLPEDMAKLGILLLNKGKWNGEEILTEEYVEQMTTNHISTEGTESPWGYGYNIWMSKDKDSFIFNGMLGQNIHCMPKTNTVVVVTGGNERLFSECDANDIIYKYFTHGYHPNKKLARDKTNENILKKVQGNLKNTTFEIKEPDSNIKRISDAFKKERIPKEAIAVLSKTYILERRYVRLQPIFTQILNNSFSQGIGKLSFENIENRLYLVLEEGYINRIPIGFKNFAYSSINVNGEEYKVATKGKFFYDEDRNLGFKISMPFIEHSNGRIIKIKLMKDRTIEVKWSEFPGRNVFATSIGTVLNSYNNSLINQLKSKVDMDLLYTLGDNVIEPTVVGTLSEIKNI